MKNFKINFTVLCIFLLAFSGCDNKSTEATKLGFSSVQEMEEIHSKGWHTKAQYEDDAAKKLGFNSAAEMLSSMKGQGKQRGRVIFRAWDETKNKVIPAVVTAIDTVAVKFKKDTELRKAA